MTFRNPNKRIGIYYDRIEANAEYHDKRFDTKYLDTFYLGHKKEHNLGTVFSGQQIVVLGNGDKSKYDRESSDGVYNIDLKLKLKMRLKVGWAKPKFKPKFECDLKVPLSTAEIPSVIVFGDSSVDAGDNNFVDTIVKSNFQPYGRDFYDRRPTGRFSNGQIATDFISEALGIRSIIPAYLDPHYNMVDFVKGVSFASAGTGYDNLTSAIMSVIPLWKELEYYKEYQNKMRTYLGAEKASKVLMEALYLISLGTNDFLENYYAFPLRSATHSIEQYENFLIGISRNFIIDLYNLGARKIAITGLPPMGCLPLQRTESFFLGKICIESYNRVAREFNMKLQQVVLSLNQELGGIRLVYSDIYNILSDIIKNPKSFGEFLVI
ncbi:GDSL esterase/lipase-like protein [Tanacetum coccineum]|uniref:GDSL esterase/lipase-like protein n=1 Tax=Tanacetum coccineum TaxID=301880 RepID=A0ABQ4ZRE9_9ASTR